MAESVLTSSEGQPLGKRGLRTRQRILDVIADLIEKHGLRGLMLADVARDVGFSPPAFYQYFQDLDEAILALCEEVSERLPEFPALNDGPQIEDVSTDRRSRPFVESFLAFWGTNHAVLWSRNVALNEGDARFRAVRDNAFEPMMTGLADTITAAQREGSLDPSIKPSLLAAALIVMIDRIGMLSPQLTGQYGQRHEDLVDAVAYVFDRALGFDTTRDG
jgi:AcrR family transcriptional regulator